MCRRETRFASSILFWMSLWVLGLGIGGILLITGFVRIQMRHNIEKNITEEMEKVRDNSLLYVHQILLLNDAVVEEEGFRQCIREVEEQIKSAGYREAAYYDLDGNLLKGSGSRFDGGNEREDFKQAVEQDSTFTLSYKGNGQCEVYFTMPVEIMEKRIGYISYYFDYQKMYQREWDTLEQTIGITVLTFVFICAVIWVILYRTIYAVRVLSRATSQISAHLKDGEFESSVVENLGLHHRKDEIGELSGNFIGLLGVAKEQFAKIQEDKDRILKLLSSRQEFYNNVTHELKTPLTTISGYAQLMEKNGLSDTELFLKGTEHILRESSRLHRMVVQLLEMQEEKSPSVKSRLDLTKLLGNVADTMQIKAKRQGSKIMLKGIGENVFVDGQEDKLRQIFINLIDNAIKYGEPKAVIRLEIAKGNGALEVSVANKGQGIKANDLENIFEPFYRADKELSRELGSTGLGLSLSRKIAREQGGEIRVKSTPGEETVFTVSLPEAESEVGHGRKER